MAMNVPSEFTQVTGRRKAELLGARAEQGNGRQPLKGQTLAPEALCFSPCEPGLSSDIHASQVSHI